MLERLSRVLWGAPTVILFLSTGLYFSLKTGFYQCFRAGTWWRETAGRILRPQAQGTGLTPLETLSTALAATIGTGSIAGVATAISGGGAGALLWMWVSGVLAMMTGWAEKVLSIALRKKTAQGWTGGPCLWLREKGCLFLARMFALCTVLASLGMGDLVQTHSMAQAAAHVWGVPAPAVGIASAAVTAVILSGGLKRLGQVSSALVPVMSLLYLAGGFWVIAAHASRLPSVLGAIISSALSRQAIATGGAAAALQYGLARGVISNEAGLGSTPMVHCQSANTHPAQEGNWGIFEVFFSTMVICTVTGLAILTSGASGGGSAQTAAAFSTVLGGWGEGLIALCLLLFGGSSLLGWSWYGASALRELAGERWVALYYALFLLLAVLGSGMKSETVWLFSDCCNALMAWPSLLSLWLWRREILAWGRGR